MTIRSNLKETYVKLVNARRAKNQPTVEQHLRIIHELLSKNTGDSYLNYDVSNVAQEVVDLVLQEIKAIGFDVELVTYEDRDERRTVARLYISW